MEQENCDAARRTMTTNAGPLRAETALLSSRNRAPDVTFEPERENVTRAKRASNGGGGPQPASACSANHTRPIQVSHFAGATMQPQ